MEKRYMPQLDETYYQEKLPNGLQVLLVPREGFSRRIAYLAVGSGSIHRHFTADGQSFEAPMGVAHYLEHKLFDMPQGDVMEQFSQLGAGVNAFTSYDMTAYYFTCTENFSQCLRLLMDFVTTGYFTEESVQKEQGIIGQEIGMYQDNPDTRVFENLMGLMYPEHPIREPILGTKESIAEITPEVLRRCHRAYYRPDNMLLCVVGDVQPEEVMALAREHLGSLPKVDAAQPDSWPERVPGEMKVIKENMDVPRPLFQLGFWSENFGWGEQSVYQEMVGDLAAEVLFGESSELYLKLYQEGLIDPSFGGGLETVEGMAMLTASGECDDPEALRDAVLQQAKKIVAQGIDPEDFRRLKRATLGSRIRSLDNFDNTCFRMCAYHFSGFSYLDFPRVLAQVKREDVVDFIARVVTPKRCCLSVVTKED